MECGSCPQGRSFDLTKSVFNLPKVFILQDYLFSREVLNVGNHPKESIFFLILMDSRFIQYWPALTVKTDVTLPSFVGDERFCLSFWVPEFLGEKRWILWDDYQR